MKLRVYEVGLDGASVSFRVPRLTFMKHIRIHIYKAGAPTGNALLQLSDPTGIVTLNQASVSIPTISSANYFHGFVKFDLAYALQAATTYYLTINYNGGYSYGASDFIGWAFAEGFQGFEIWEQKNLIRGA